MPEYNPNEIEKKWQEIWNKSGVYHAPDETSREKYYTLIEFPFLSGEGLHVGHFRPYIGMDVIARKRRMQGFNSLYPIGWDAFGLPAENYAIKTGVKPALTNKKNIENYTKQLKAAGISFDWAREIDTADPAYYKWTQWIFLKFFEKGLAYKAKIPINWCPKDKIGLANEEVIDGKCERCGTPVEEREKEQWMLKITAYANRLLNDLDATDYEMPLLVDKVNPHKGGAPLVKRRVAHAIVYDPREKKFLIIRNKKFGWDTVVIGGIEGNESVEAAARREVEEETGYADIEFKRILGGPTEAHYHTPHKGENRVAIAQAAYFELKSGKRVDIHKENLTAGEASHNEILWVDEKDFVPGKLVNSELPIWLERLGVEVYFDKRNPSVPCFKDIRGSSAYREGAPIIEREAVVVVIKHWKDDSYIGLKWKKVDWQTILTGGVEAGQTPEEAAMAEIREETGYQNIRFVKKLGNVDASFYHVPKGVNRYGHFYALYFELINGEQKELTEEEKANHDLVWVPKEEMNKFLTVAAQKYVWDVLFLGKKSHFIELTKPLVDYPEPIKAQQRNWIGKSEGALVKFDDIEVFTTRPDTIRGATFVVVAGKKDKFTGRSVKNPATGKEVPVWEAEYVYADYGTGAIMGVPADDERDRAFAEKHGLPIIENYEKAGFEEFGKKVVKYKLRDWVFSRQRYWGEPIPMVWCERDGWVPIPETELPLTLPEVEKYEPTESGESPLSSIASWVNTTCPKCGGKARRETDTMPNWAGSSWYFLRYTDPHNDKEFASQGKLKYWIPVDWYNGDTGHTTLHLLYSRFWHKFLFDLGLVPTSEPYKKRTSHGHILAQDGGKMSKSRPETIIDPASITERFGADTLRVYEMFMGPFRQAIPWSEDSLIGPRRFLERVWKIKEKISGTGTSTILHQTIKKVSEDIETLGFNTSISALMILANDFEKREYLSQEEYESLLKLLAPFAPHMAEELWHELGHRDSIHLAPWPHYDEKKLVADEVTIVVQVDGKVRGKFTAASTITEAEALEQAKKMPEVMKWLENKKIEQTHFVAHKLVNFVLS